MNASGSTTLASVNRSRLLAVGLLMAVLGLLLLAVTLPMLHFMRDASEEIEELQFRLGRYQRAASEREHWLARLEQIKQESQQDERFIARGTAALAAADLQTLIKETVTQAGGELISTQVIPERREQERFTRVGVKVRMNGSMEVLREVLYEIESSQPTLLIDNLNIRPIRVQRTLGAKQTQPVSRLSVDFDVIGYMRAS